MLLLFFFFSLLFPPFLFSFLFFSFHSTSYCFVLFISFALDARAGNTDMLYTSVHIQVNRMRRVRSACVCWSLLRLRASFSRARRSVKYRASLWPSFSTKLERCVKLYIGLMSCSIEYTGITLVQRVLWEF